MALEPFTGLRVLDLYAGSGALGIEALSRGARHADFAESDARALDALRANLEALAAGDRARLWRLTLPRGLNRLGEAMASADLVLMDPPYGGNRAVTMLEALDSSGQLREGVRVVVEHSGRDVLPERSGRLARERERRYGQTRVTTYRVAGGPPPEPPGAKGI